MVSPDFLTKNQAPLAGLHNSRNKIFILCCLFFSAEPAEPIVGSDGFATVKAELLRLRRLRLVWYAQVSVCEEEEDSADDYAED